MHCGEGLFSGTTQPMSALGRDQRPVRFPYITLCPDIRGRGFRLFTPPPNRLCDCCCSGYAWLWINFCYVFLFQIAVCLPNQSSRPELPDGLFYRLPGFSFMFAELL